MVVQYDVTDVQAQQTPLFNPIDLYHILNGNLGLRLTDRPTEIEDGGFGDAIPLSHLGGAKDCIYFVTIAALLLRNPDIESSKKVQHLQTLTQIFASYAGHDQAQIAFTPALMLVYASLLKISSVQISDKLLERRLPADEEKLLIKCYTMTDGAILPIIVFDRESNYYANFPSLRLHLTSDFNQLLEKRLILNRRYYSAQSMHYLLLTDSQSRFASGYDFSHYPFGKAGSAGFTKEDVLGHVVILDESISSIWTWLKQQCAAKLQTAPTMLPDDVPEQPQTYAQQCVKFCQDNKAYVASMALGMGLFVGYKVLRYTQGRPQSATWIIESSTAFHSFCPVFLQANKAQEGGARRAIAGRRTGQNE